MSAKAAGTYPYNHDGSIQRYWDGADWSGDPFMSPKRPPVSAHAPVKRPTFKRWWSKVGKSAWT